MQKEKAKDEYTICARCESYRPPRAHHCRVCQRCIRRMDHHCPWINNCVGEWNQKYFLQFLFYVGLLSTYAVVLVIISWLQECNDCYKDKLTMQSRVVHSVLLVVESGLFGLFVTAIMCDQLQAIFGDETAVEQAKQQGPYRPKKPRLALLSEVCGRGFPMLWLMPCQSPPKDFEFLSGYDVWSTVACYISPFAFPIVSDVLHSHCLVVQYLFLTLSRSHTTPTPPLSPLLQVIHRLY